MKRKDFIDHITKKGCIFVREGGSHTVYKNPAKNKKTTIPRHNEIDDLLCKKICKQLEIPSI